MIWRASDKAPMSSVLPLATDKATPSVAVDSRYITWSDGTIAKSDRAFGRCHRSQR